MTFTIGLLIGEFCGVFSAVILLVVLAQKARGITKHRRRLPGQNAKVSGEITGDWLAAYQGEPGVRYEFLGVTGSEE
ncbi:hypothetical protein AB4Y43_01270 [Paraburkholderia sp. BR10872]|uniref:hypothetical protein n=1 Tax=Paraburkholderia sp. BR10872 TaxID=3236989 RepID=UPI0034D361F8